MNGESHRSDRACFSLPFQSAMSEADRALLRSQLGMTTHSHPKHPAVDPPLGFAPLDADSGLYLVGRGNSWAIECRTWGRPSGEQVSRWYLMTTHVIAQLDPRVSDAVPPRPGLHADNLGREPNAVTTTTRRTKDS